MTANSMEVKLYH